MLLSESPRTIRSLVLALSVSCFASASLAAEPAVTSSTRKHAVKAAPQVKVKVLQVDKLQGKLDGKPTTVTMLEVTLEPLAGSPPHRHPGPLTGYVAEGTLEFQIGDRPLQKFKKGDTFFEPAMILHRVGRNPDPKRKTRLIVTMIHPSDIKQLVIPELRKSQPEKPQSPKPQSPKP